MTKTALNTRNSVQMHCHPHHNEKNCMSLKFWKLQLIMYDSQERAICQRCAHICRRKACLTSAVSETAVVAHGTEVLEHEDGDGRNQQQHDEHHDPDVSAEGLCGRRTETDASHGSTDRQTGRQSRSRVSHRGTQTERRCRCSARP